LALWVAAASQRAAQQGSGAELLKLQFLWLVGATTYVIIGGGCANPQSPHFERYIAKIEDSTLGKGKNAIESMVCTSSSRWLFARDV
jgi:hypothetical protein